jgi:hypothetical protein
MDRLPITPHQKICGLFQSSLDLRLGLHSISLIISSCDKIYEMESTFRKTGASIGLGMKFDFTKDQTCSPGASKYTIDT